MSETRMVMGTIGFIRHSLILPNIMDSHHACKPYRAKTKGKVERFNGYLRQSF